MTLGQKGTYWLFIHPKLLKYETYVTEVLEFISPVRQDQRGSWWKVVLVAEVAFLAVSKQPAAAGEPISKGDRHDKGAAAPFSTKIYPYKGELEVRLSRRN